MIRSKWCDAVCVIVICLAVAVTVLFMNGKMIGIQSVRDEDAEANEEDEVFTENDLDGDWDASSATVIKLSDSEINISGDGAYALNGDLVIAKSGKYVISGELTNGSIIVDAADNSKIWVKLDGVSLTAEDDACFKVEQADKVFLTLASGSENTMVSGEEMSDEALEDGVDGTIFSHDDLTINGSGALTVTSGYKFGIVANDDLVITGGNISVDAAAAAIHVNDSLHVTGAKIAVTAGSDGLHAGAEILLAGGNITIDAGDDGIHSDADVTIDDGTIVINECYEGIEGKNITVNGGEITVYPTDDGFNASNGSISGMGFGMTGMGQHMQTGQTGSSSAPEITENVESAQNTATETVSSQSDSDSAATPPTVTINGGKIMIINGEGQDADGIDSNGNICINGGEVYIDLIGSGSNCALDYGSESGGECLINGGTVIACGGSSMIEEMSDNSAQASVLYVTMGRTDDGSLLKVTDSEGNEVLRWEVPYGYTSAVLSSPAIEKGSSYTVSTGDSEETVTVSDTAQRVSSSGSSTSSAGAFGTGGSNGMHQHGMQSMNAPQGNRGFGTGNAGADFTPAAFGADTDSMDGTEENNRGTIVTGEMIRATAASGILLLSGLLLAGFYHKRKKHC